jgi:signal transduction histidine kinase
VDIAVFVIVGLVIVTLVLAALAGADGLGIPLALVAIGVLGAVPAALRNVTAVVRDVVITVATIGAAGGIYFGARAAGASLGEVPRRLVDLGALLGLVLLLVPGRSWLQGALDRVILRHTRRVRSDLQDFLHTLSPELGTVECCRRALAHLARAYRLRGAAVLLHDGTALVEGDLSLEPLRAVWPTGALADLPSQPFMWLSLDDVRLRRALAAADVAGVLPIVSPRRRWGHLFTSIGIFGWDKSAEQVEAGAAFCDQLARVLDAAELLARAIAFERSLAHAEKLAAIGETAARIAHDIRNPITAARSLAQQLAREPAAPFKAEHHVIPGELERVERQVAALLQFARRDELHLAAVDLGVLVGATAAAFRPRLEAAGISLELTLADALTARADAEKLRQAVVNLIENAVDALAGRAAKRLAVDVASTNGRASIAITDSGPGVPADALPHVFEPFFSLKEHGTGLGLAIARRTAEAHGGTIEAAAAPGGGMTFRLRLPLA